MNVQRALKNSSVCRSLTGLTPKEFLNLVPVFDLCLEDAKNSKKRKRKAGAGPKHSLKTSAEKLFFILFYLKVYPTFAVLCFLYDVHRSRPQRWVKQFLPILEKALGKKCCLPERKINSEEDFITKFGSITDIFIDGSERPIQRPKNKQKRKEHYSGKKKRLTKNQLFMTDKKKRVLALGELKPGAKNDKGSFDEEGWGDVIPKIVKCHVDKGFQGIHHYGLDVNIPKKKPPGGELTEAEKEQNKQISKIRIVNEHAIGGVKRYGAVAQICRNKGNDLPDEFAVAASGLWNYHLDFKEVA